MYKKEKRELEEEYKKKQEELFKWKENKERELKERYDANIKHFTPTAPDSHSDCDLTIGDNLASIAYHTFWPNQFNVKDGRSACVSISTLCVYTFLHKNTNPLEMRWPSIIKRGAAIWRTWKNETKSIENFQMVTEVLESVEMKKAKYKLEIEYEVAGSIDENWIKMYNETSSVEDRMAFFTLENVVEHLCNGDAPRGVIITIRNGSFSLLHNPSKGKTVWLFDSHGGHTPNHSTLIQCKSATDMIKHLKGRYYIERPSSVLWKYHDTKDTQNFFHATFFKKANKKNTLNDAQNNID